MPRKRRSSKPARPAAAGGEAVTVHPVEGRFVSGVPHVTTDVTAAEAAGLVATGAFAYGVPANSPVKHEPECNEQCDPATGTHHLIGDAAGEDPPPPAEAATQPDGPADEAESAHGSAEEPVAPAI